jgi:hypothetical protein
VIPRLTALAALLLATAALTARDDAKGALPADLALVGDAGAFARFDVGAAWNGREAELLKKLTRSHPMIWLWEGHGLEKALGLKLEEIDRVVVVLPNFAVTDNALAVVTTRKPFDRDKVLAALAPAGKEAKAGGRAYVADEKAGLAVHVPGKSSFVVGSVAGVKAFLGKAPAKTYELAEALAAAARKPLLAVGLNPQVLIPLAEKAGEDGKAFLTVCRAQSWQLTAEGGDRLTLNFRFAFRDADAAKAAVPAIKAAVAPLDGYLALAERQMPDAFKRDEDKYKGVKDLVGPLGETLKATRAALKAFKPEQDGSVVRGSLRIETKTPAAALLILSAMVPRPAKEKG